MTVELVLMFLALGAFVGVMAGLLGIGGGVIVVPALVYILPLAGISPHLCMSIALATSLSTIILTSGSSAMNHFRLGNVDIFVVKWLMPGVVIGGFAGATVAEWIPHQYLPRIFALIVFSLGVQMLHSVKSVKTRPMPGSVVTMISGATIGILASLAGIGGGSLSVPFLNRHGVEMRKAVGSSSVCGCFIAISGMTGFILHGAHVKGLPPYSLGYVYLPALLSIAVVSVFTTRIGANLATRLPTAKLKRIFAVFLMFIALTMLV